MPRLENPTPVPSKLSARLKSASMLRPEFDNSNRSWPGCATGNEKRNSAALFLFSFPVAQPGQLLFELSNSGLSMLALFNRALSLLGTGVGFSSLGIQYADLAIAVDDDAKAKPAGDAAVRILFGLPFSVGLPSEQKKPLL